ncbi:MAG: glucose-6-phosphate isomerase [Deltaproteobacteria bacterium]
MAGSRPIRFRFDFSLVRESNLRNREGMTASRIGRGLRRAARALRTILRQRDAGTVGFPDLPFRERESRRLSRAAAQYRRRFRRVLVLGIGGSALGTKAVWEGLGGEGDSRGMEPVVADNVDPDVLVPLFRSLPWKRTLVVAISKSGGTAETKAQLALAVEALRRAVGARWREHLVLVTDPRKGAFREFADREGLASFPVPPDVGGRFSVLSPVGLFPLAAAGVSVGRLLAGARWMETAIREREGEENPALYAAAVYSHYLLENVKPVQVWFGYGQGLERMGEWWQQLWAESLGKRRPSGSPVGQTPARAVGVTDQHSQVQLYQDGPNDRLFTFVKWMEGREETKVPALRILPGMEILGGRPLRDLFDAEFEGTVGALWKAGRPIVRMEIGRRDELHIGAFLQFWEWVTALSGTIAGIDPFDQPGVEAGKVLTRALMGEKGSEERRDRFRKALKGRDPAGVILRGTAERAGRRPARGGR